ncbi:uncharacterized protein LOC127736596 isoform X2 [Mytilus californianus]|nr:uncharacterized protein LOC127736596 isoform X2 [Mytilus californianus]
MNITLKILSPSKITGKLIKSNWKQTPEAIETSYQSKCNGHLTVLGVNITVLCTLLSFTFRLSGIDNFTNYATLVCNEYGCNNFEIAVVSESKSAKKQNIAKMVFVWISVVAIVIVVVISFVKCVSLKIRIRGIERQANNTSESIFSPDAEGEAIENRLYQSAHVLEASAIQNQLSEGYEIGVISNVSSPSIVLLRNQEETQDERSPDTQLSQIGNPNLNYAELVFEAAGPSTETHSRSIIHGAEDRTLYSEIDLLRRASARPSTNGSDDDDFMYVDGIENFSRKNIKNET